GAGPGGRRQERCRASRGRRQIGRALVPEVDPGAEGGRGRQQGDGEGEPAHQLLIQNAWSSRCPLRARRSGPTATTCEPQPGAAAPSGRRTITRWKSLITARWTSP